MRRFADPRLRRASAACASALAASVLLAAFGRLDPPPLTGQDTPTLTEELRSVLAQSRPQDRVPVVIELDHAETPDPGPAPRALRAARHAGDLAAAYGGRLQELRASAPLEIARELDAADLLWVGGAAAARLTPEQLRALEGRPGVRAVYYDGLVRVDLAAVPGSPVAARDRRGPAARALESLTGARVPVRGPIRRARGEAGPAIAGARGAAAAQQADDISSGVRTVGAPALWEAGITGEGTVIAIIDSGVDGDHPLLRHGWRGLRTDPRESWFDPWGLNERPQDDNFTAGVGHGTMVATIAVGRLAPGDTLLRSGEPPRAVEGDLEIVTGVAPGAEWIAANAFEEFGGGTYTRRSILLQSMQWAVDPDGDPLTPGDIPDVVNNSWGFLPGRCDGLFDRAIDALERVGVPVVFAAGNRASGFDTIAAPGNRADLLLNAFSVGAVQERAGEIVVAENSLGGPSPCLPGTVKPEVVAPGVAPVLRAAGERTVTLIGNSGPFTSWAAPHASGALALLRAADPSASPEDVKNALFITARDLPPAGLDNRSGAGLIDVSAAAAQLGGVGGVRLELVAWDWRAESGELTLELMNRGAAGFAGGAARLLRAGDGALLASGSAPAIAPRGGAALRFDGLELDVGEGLVLTLRLESAGATLALPVRLARPTATAVELSDGAVRLALDAHGRLGRVAGGPGFEFAGGDRLIAGTVLFARGDRVSDAGYVDVQARPLLKSNPVGSDTDWSGSAALQDPTRADLILEDARALNPTGVRLEARAHLASLGDTAGYAALGITPEFTDDGSPAVLGVLLDWDFDQGDRVLWDDQLGASVMTDASGAGPWVALTTEPGRPTTHTAVRLGNVQSGFYTVGSGVLAGPVTDELKARLLRLGGSHASAPGVTDWAHMVGLGPVRSGARQAFLVAVGTTRAAAAAALAEARAFARQSGLADPGATTAAGLHLLPAYPNPFDPGADGFVTLPYLVERADGPLEAALDIYTISGRRVYSERRDLGTAAAVEPFRWDGRLSGGELAATGVYGYVIRIGGRSERGRFLVLK